MTGPFRVPLRVGGTRLFLAGGFRLVADGADAQLPLGAQRLVSYLVLAGRPADRRTISSVLWPDAAGSRATGNVRSAVWRVRKSAPGVLRGNGTSLTVNEGVWVDLRAGIAAAQAILASTTVPLAPVDLDLLEEDLLLDWDDDWVVIERERFRQLRLHALEKYCRGLHGEGNFPLAVQVGMAAVLAEPLRESAQRALIAAHLAEGNDFEAIRQYQLYLAAAQEMGIAPSAQIRSLITRRRPD